MKRFGRKEGMVSFIVPGVTFSLIAFAIGYAMWPYVYYVKNETIVTLGLFALWRYGWQVTHYIRSAIYSFAYYPRLCRVVASCPENQKYPAHIFFVIPSFKEEPWVSIEAFQALLSNLSSVPCRSTLVVATGADQDDAVITAAYKAHPAHHKVELVLQRQSQGKRIAMGHALRAVARRYDFEPNSVTIFMDGDSYLEPRTLNKTVPFFSVFGDLGALTTNEIAYINTSSQWYKEWFTLKFGQRHVLFQSQSLSNKVLTLTGRFSMFRTSIVVTENFIRQLETDAITHWRHGKFRFLMGDDKTTWFHLLRDGWKMLYIPDVTTYSLESRDASFLSVSTSLPYRWYGNTLRNNDRALALGWRTTGLFTWISILDQRLSMWTSLVGITGAIILSIFKSFVYLPFYFAWVFMVRTVQMGVIAFNGHHVSLSTIPLMLFGQWVGAFIKIRAYFHLSDQKWSKGGDKQDSDENVRMIKHPFVKWIPSYMMYASYGLFLFTLLLTEGAISMPEIEFFYRSDRQGAIQADFFGVIPNDGHDDALALQEIIDRLPNDRDIVIQLPRGQIDLYGTVRLRSHISLLGYGPNQTRIVSHLKHPDESVIAFHGALGARIGRLTRDTQADDRQLFLSDTRSIQSGDLLLVEMPNDRHFLQELGSEQWDKEYPYLRKMLVEVDQVRSDRITTHSAIGLMLTAGLTRIYRVHAVSHIRLEGFTVEQQVEGATPEGARFEYENSHPEYAIDTISGKWAAHCVIENLHIYNSGRHPLVLDNVYACDAQNLLISGAWNKGKDGNGYVKFSRTFHSHFLDSRVSHIRHIVLQWSSAFNTLSNIKAGVDVNLHGGYTHDNVIRNVAFDIPPAHPWKGIVKTPTDAHWAPPDGQNLIPRE